MNNSGLARVGVASVNNALVERVGVAYANSSGLAWVGVASVSSGGFAEGVASFGGVSRVGVVFVIPVGVA